MFSEFAMMMVMMWPLVPLFLIQIHYATNFWRKLGVWTYFVVFLEWLPIAYAAYLWQAAILQYEVSIATPFRVLGVVAIAAGIALHTWTAKLLGIKATIGYTELKPDKDTKSQSLITSGPFAVVRHPSYWAHTLIIMGTFMITGVVIMGIIAIIDLAIAYFVTTELEDRELIARFGSQYREYQTKVPKFFPKPRRNKTAEK
jgi:protein-S-isoprenylcysteine O-methyltransferase Ste14